MRWGAVVLDVVGNDTAVGQELIEDDPAALTAKRREAVEELYTWARAQAAGNRSSRTGSDAGSRRLAPVRGGRWKNKSSLAALQAGKETRVGEVTPKAEERRAASPAGDVARRAAGDGRAGESFSGGGTATGLDCSACARNALQRRQGLGPQRSVRHGVRDHRRKRRVVSCSSE